MTEENKLIEIFLRLLENDASDQDIADFEKWYELTPDANEIYWNFIKDYEAFRVACEAVHITGISAQTNGEPVNHNILSALSENERSAPTIVPEQNLPESSNEILTLKIKAFQQNNIRGLKKGFWSTLGLVASIIMVLSIILYTEIIRFQPGKIVATLADGQDISWRDSAFSDQINTPFYSRQKTAQLDSGLAKFMFINGVKLVMEAPAAIKFISEDKISLDYGRIYVRVPDHSIGFTVLTHNSEIIDLGTGFGIYADQAGSASIHVMDGQVNLLSGNKRKHNLSKLVTVGQAYEVSADGQKVDPIAYSPTLFARDLSPINGNVWRGGSLDLVDISNGGLGIDLKTTPCTINPFTGEIIKPIREDMSLKITTNPSYCITDSLWAVDGVFVPQPVFWNAVVSSDGHVFMEMPRIAGGWHNPILTQAVQRYIYIDTDNQPTYRNIEEPVIAGEYYCRPGNMPGMIIHSNQGITYDLDKLRQALPFIEITGLKARLGHPDSAYKICRTDFWVLLDGQLRFHYAHDPETSESIPLSLPLERSNRFLTMIATDGNDSINNDWWGLIEPRLTTREK